MIAKTTTGSNFERALGYGAADLTVKQRQQKQPQVALLDSYNLISYDWSGMAAEMGAVAQGSRCKTPVWHTSLSAQPGEQLTGEQWRAAARQYCTAIGADPAQHQVAIFQHHDTAHAHVHIYINRVRLDDGPALDTGHNYARNVKTTRQIEQTLGLTALPEQRTSLRDHSQQTQALRQTIADVLTQVLATDKPTSLAELTADLDQRGITTQLASNAKGGYGISFQRGDSHPIKGSAVGFKYRQVAARLEANRAEYQAEIDRLQKELEQKPPTVEIEQPDAGQQAEIDRLKLERDEAYAKRNFMQEVLLNQPAKTVIKEVEVEVIKPDPRDQEQIEQLQQQVQRDYEAFLKQKQRADKVPELEQSVQDLTKQNQGLVEINRQQQVEVEQSLSIYRELAEQYKTHITKYTELMRRYNEQKERLRAKTLPTTPTNEPPATIPSQVLPTAVPVLKDLPIEPKQPATAQANLDPAWVASMSQRIRQAAKAAGNSAQFETHLRSVSQTNPPISRRKGVDGKYIYQDKGGQATAAELGFQAGELKRLIEAPVQAKTWDRGMG
jgi:glycine cleavage system regulatory protein